MQYKKLYVANKVSSCRTLGPGNRGVVWLSGCSRKCTGCIATSIKDRHSGLCTGIEQLAEEILSWEDIEGVTFSGGEPFEQANALADLCDILKHQGNLSIMSYTGYTIAEVKESSDAGQLRFLQCLDILVDGPFVKSLQEDLLWRGSSNQKILFLTKRYQNWASEINMPSVGIEVHISKEGIISWIGIPEVSFEEKLAAGLNSEGIKLNTLKRVWI